MNQRSFLLSNSLRTILSTKDVQNCRCSGHSRFGRFNAAPGSEWQMTCLKLRRRLSCSSRSRPASFLRIRNFPIRINGLVECECPYAQSYPQNMCRSAGGRFSDGFGSFTGAHSAASPCGGSRPRSTAAYPARFARKVAPAHPISATFRTLPPFCAVGIFL
jgi:hypothetical protein